MAAAEIVFGEAFEAVGGGLEGLEIGDLAGVEQVTGLGGLELEDLGDGGVAAGVGEEEEGGDGLVPLGLRPMA